MTRMPEKHRPRKLEDLLGNPKAHEQLRSIMMDPRGRALLSGGSGIGKTSAVHALAEELKLKVIEINASADRSKDQLKDIGQRCQMFSASGEGMVYLLDEIEGVVEGTPNKKQVWDSIEEILTYSRYPVVLTTNDPWDIPKKIKQLSVEIKLRRPYMKSVVDAARRVAEEEGISLGTYRNIKKQDIRNATNVVMYGGESYEEVTPFSIATDFFTKGDLERVVMKDAAWLFDNAPTFLFGADLYEFYSLLEIASRSDIGILKLAAKGKGDYARFPTYYRRGSTSDDKQEE